MPVQIMTPREIMTAIQALPQGLYSTRTGGKRLILSILNQMQHLEKLEEAHKQLMEESERYRASTLGIIEEYCRKCPNCKGCALICSCDKVKGKGGTKDGD